MTEPLSEGWYTWPDSKTSDHLIAHWFRLSSPCGGTTICGRWGKWEMPLKSATTHRHCRVCERALRKRPSPGPSE